ncbi:hypothetical protein KY290_000258 [Solanum tuberosum]|uniref:Uncharacterized protein n=1 Tax=Solanum tuberosum TaxID=4113 RepID=A0ABQ7WKZ9_SOLTU|nr:hypothetical protein KY290_000258 [Solanum tuberosum]
MDVDNPLATNELPTPGLLFFNIPSRETIVHSHALHSSNSSDNSPTRQPEHPRHRPLYHYWQIQPDRGVVTTIGWVWCMRVHSGVSLVGMLKNNKSPGAGSLLVAEGLSTSIDGCCKSPWLSSSPSKTI